MCVTHGDSRVARLLPDQHDRVICVIRSITFFGIEFF